VSLTGPERLGPGRVGTYTLSLAGGQELAGGLDVAVDAGSLGTVPADAAWTQLLNGELTHTLPRAGALLTWTFQWVAPDELGTYTIHAAALSADGDGTPAGDGAATTRLAVDVAGCPDADEDGYEDAACNPSPLQGGGDCDDNDPQRSPEAPERCDGVDQDCDGLTDEDPSLVLCDDGEACTTDRCVEGACEYDDNRAACDDGDACTRDDRCLAGECGGDVPRDCDDGDPCTTDLCLPDRGCVSTPLDGGPCDDGNACTVGDQCVAGVCTGGASSCPCAEDSDCEDSAPADRCRARLRCALELPTPVCVVDPGTVVRCDPSADSECSRNTCDPLTGTCALTPLADGTPCALADACRNGAVCEAGACRGGEEADCDDGNPCTENACDPAGGCLRTNLVGPCDDGNACTTNDQCRSGVCTPGAPAGCGDANPCTEDSCDPLAGCVHTALDAVPCDDGDACSTGDRCVAGVCLYLDERDCDDDNPCTDDFCDPVRGCVHDESSTGCDDGDPCTANDVCHARVCLPGPPVDCDDGNPCTTDSCDPERGCVHTDSVAGCDDGDACTVADGCVDGACGGRPRTCDDFDGCTENGCDPRTGCVYTAIPACCSLDEDCAQGQRCRDARCVGAGLCEPCTRDADCGTAADECLALRNGRFCGRACAVADDCPADFVCEPQVAGDPQCVPGPELIACECTEHAALRCVEAVLYWFDSCDRQEDPAEDCPFGCADGRCIPSVDPGDVVIPGRDVAGADTGGGGGEGGDGGGGGGCAAPGGAPFGAAGGLLLALLGALLGVLVWTTRRPRGACRSR
jgi:hypothetical protein